MRIKIHSEQSEIEASVVKGYLESAGISASIAPGENSLGNSPKVFRGPNVTHEIFVEENDVEKAKNILVEMKQDQI